MIYHIQNRLNDFGILSDIYRDPGKRSQQRADNRVDNEAEFLKFVHRPPSCIERYQEWYDQGDFHFSKRYVLYLNQEASGCYK